MKANPIFQKKHTENQHVTTDEQSTQPAIHYAPPVISVFERLSKTPKHTRNCYVSNTKQQTLLTHADKSALLYPVAASIRLYRKEIAKIKQKNKSLINKVISPPTTKSFVQCIHPTNPYNSSVRLLTPAKEREAIKVLKNRKEINDCSFRPSISQASNKLANGIRSKSMKNLNLIDYLQTKSTSNEQVCHCCSSKSIMTTAHKSTCSSNISYIIDSPAASPAHEKRMANLKSIFALVDECKLDEITRSKVPACQSKYLSRY